MREHTLHGAHLKHYRLEDVIGVGSFATAYRAVDEQLHATVVVKVLAENHSLNAEIRERFIAEGRSLRRVGGQHAVTIHDMGETDRQQPYLVLEHADRGTVQDRVTQLWSQGWRARRDDVLAFARPLAAAVEAVHAAQLVHRDLSPGNVLLTSEPTALAGAGSSGPARPPTAPTGRGTARDRAQTPASQLLRDDERLLIADLGMCKDLALNSGLTVAAGTSGFRPPEQSGPGVVDIRADIWALSALLVWISQESDLPRALHRVLRRGMAARPERRQPDAATWLEEVEEALAPREPTPDPPTEPEPEPRTQAPASLSRHRTLVRAAIIGSLVACGALAGLIGGHLLWDPDDPPSRSQHASVAVEGPEEVAVGERTLFSADVRGASSWSWLLPTGRYVIDEETITLTPTSVGSAELILRALAPDGTELQARHVVRVVE